MLLNKKSMIAMASSIALLAACNGQQNAYNAGYGGVTGGGGLDKSDIGTGLGALGGAVIGSSFGKGNGRVVGGVLGGLLGAGIGHEIGASMDRSDMQYYQQAQYQALENYQPGQSLPWNNPQNGHSGSFTPQAYYQSPNGQYCREFSQIINVGGQRQTAYGTACRQPDGNWQIVSQQ
jgi:surface antigen